MAYALGVGAHVGFGLGFLNLFGTILFFLFIFWALKGLFRGMRYGGPRGGWGSRSWGGPPWSRFGHGPRGSRGHSEHGGHDEAVTTARERFAEGEIDADAFAAIKQALGSDRPAGDEGYGPRSHDHALSLARMRLARSEITAEEFDVVRKTLNG